MNKNHGYLQGMIKRHPDGFGFFIPEKSDHPDVYIPKNSMQGIMTNDRVMIQVYPEKGGERFRGEIIKVIERGTSSALGRIFLGSGKYGEIRDESGAWGGSIRIELEDSKGAQDGDWVLVQITSYPDEAKGFRGLVTEVIGQELDPLHDVKRVLVGNSIPFEFPKEVLKEAQEFEEEVGEEDKKGRRSITQIPFITIDGVTAKDFDDAIYVETNEEGFRLLVAIADVSHYVRPNSAIDEEAFIRGNSVYFPRFVVPMLPEVLSNGLCSLRPNTDRLAFVADIQMDFQGEPLRSEFYEAVIQSHARVTYGEAQEIIDGNQVESLKHVTEEIKRASDLAKVLMARRFKQGSLDLEIPETEVILDDLGNPIDIQRSERIFAHRLIEELMLAANVAVAEYFVKKDIPAIYRIHEEPDPESIMMLERYLHNFGAKTRFSGGKLQKKISRALEDFQGRPEAQILNILTLRSMSQAKYSPHNVGHFGLGFENYTHFTSPIRRYSDLIVHRLLKNLVMPKSHYRLMPEEELERAGAVLSATEQRAVKSERQFQAIKRARFMRDKIGQEFDGVISSVAKFGAFVLLREYDVDGLVRLEDLSKDKLEFDSDNLALFGPRSGIRFNIGDTLRIRVVDADIELGQINFQPTEIIAKKEANQRDASTDRNPNRKNNKKRKKAKNNSRGVRKARVSQSRRKD